MTLYTTLASTLVAAYALVVIGVPTGCTIIGDSGEGFPVAHCVDGSYVYFDADGNGSGGGYVWRDAGGYMLRGH